MRNLQKIKQFKKIRRKMRVRAKISGTEKRPRLCVSRSIKHISAQLIDDISGQTLIGISDIALKKNKKEGGERSKVASAFEVGKLIAMKAKEKGIKSVVFDRGSFKYHGRVKAVADGAREGGLEF